VKTVFKSSFAKDLKSIKSKPVLDAVAQRIERVEAAQSLRAIPDVKKLQAKGSCYRIKLGDHRIGINRVQGRDHIRSVPESQGCLPVFPMT
jgi:mRNA-degrading endonuclease RelE of RelBE toxin-antitoxin system